MGMIIDVTLAGLTFSCALSFAKSAVFPAPDFAAPRVQVEPVCLTEEDWTHYLSLGLKAEPKTEFSLLTAPFSEALMRYQRLIYHAVALRWREKAYLIAAPSGVGKSTQTRFLQELRPGEFSVICGDRPILEFRHSERSEESASPVAAHSVRHSFATTDKDEIIVHPSPWNGKENWHGAEAAPLAGLILLERGEKNRLMALSPREAALPAYLQVIQTNNDESCMRKSAELITELLRSVPIWKLISYQVPDSTQLLLESVFS